VARGGAQGAEHAPERLVTLVLVSFGRPFLDLLPRRVVLRRPLPARRAAGETREMHEGLGLRVWGARFGVLGLEFRV
jgi:hypothetical protein